MLQVLPAGHYQRHIHAVIGQGQVQVGIEVLQPVAIKPGVGCQLLGVEPMANHLLVADVFRQVADPAAHQIKHHCAGGNALAVEQGQPLAEAGIKVLYEAGFGVEEGVVGAVELVALGLTQHRHGGRTGRSHGAGRLI